MLAQEVPAAEVNPEFYLSHTDKAFCLKTPSLDVVINLLRNIDEKKATGLDMIPSKLLKMAASIVAPSLTAIFTKSIITGVYLVSFAAVFWDVTQCSTQRNGCSHPNNIPFHCVCGLVAVC